MAMTKYTSCIGYDQEIGDYVLELPNELTLELNWSSGDTIEWIDNQDGTWTLRKVENDAEI